MWKTENKFLKCGKPPLWNVLRTTEATFETQWYWIVWSCSLPVPVMWVKFFHLAVRSFDLHNNGPPLCGSAFLIWISIHHRRPLLAGGKQTNERTLRHRSSFRFRIFFALDGHEGQKKRTLELYGIARQTKPSQEQLQLLSVNRVHAVNHEPSKPELSFSGGFR